MAKPDNRSDNVGKLQDAVRNTTENMKESQEYLAEQAGELSPQMRANIQAKNERRREAIAGKQAEIEDELNAQQ